MHVDNKLSEERTKIISSVNQTMLQINDSLTKPSYKSPILLNKDIIFTDRAGIKINQMKLFRDKLKRSVGNYGKNSLLNNRSYSLLNLRNSSERLLPGISINKMTSVSKMSSISPSDSSTVKNIPFCPHCSHCQKLTESECLDNFILEIKEAKSIISRGCEFILAKECLEDLDRIFKFTEPETKLLSEEDEEELKKLKEKRFINFEDFQNEYKKNVMTSQDRNRYKIVCSYLSQIVNGKIELEDLTSPQIVAKLEEKLIAKGRVFDKKADKIVFDPEIEALFDGKTKEIISSTFKKKYLSSLDELKKDNEKMNKEVTKKYLVLFLIFLQVLCDISLVSKEKSQLLYKFFINFFAEQDKKWIYVVEKMKKRVKFYKNLAKTILAQKHKSLEHIEDINNVLFSNKVTKENLDQHKHVINELLQLVNEKRETIYQMEAENSILKHELNFWIYDFDNIKLDKRVREKREAMDINSLIENIDEEMKYKHLTKCQKSIIINSDIFLMISGQREYFYEQKKFYVSENKRLAQVVIHKQERKMHYKDLLKENKLLLQKEKISHKEEVSYLRERLTCQKENKEVQTDVDIIKFNKFLKNNDLIVKHKRLTTTKLLNIVEKVIYHCSKVKPLSKRSLLNFIPDLYIQKYNSDNQRDKENLPKYTLGEFFIIFMEEKFKLQKLVKKHSEETISAVLQYEKEDPRIQLFKRFLGIDQKDKILREVLDVYLVLIQNLPVSFSKLYYDHNYTSYLMDTNFCFEILHTRLGFYNLINYLRDVLIISSNIFKPMSKEPIKINSDKKRDYYYLSRFSEKNLVYFNELVSQTKKNINKESLTSVVENIQEANSMFNLNEKDVVNMLKRYFKVDEKEGTIELGAFLDFFVDKMVFRIQVYEFSEFVLNGLIHIFEGIRKELERVLAEMDFKGKLLYYKDFEYIILKMIKNSEIKWKLSSYFNDVCGDSRDFISKEELTNYVLNSKDIQFAFFTQNYNDYT